MILDDLDIFIVVHIHRAILENRETSTTCMAKEFFTTEQDLNELKNHYKANANRFLTAKSVFIMNRLKKFSEEGLVKIEKNGKRDKFILNNEKIFITKHKFNGKRVDSIILQGKKNKWMAFEI